MLSDKEISEIASEVIDEYYSVTQDPMISVHIGAEGDIRIQTKEAHQASWILEKALEKQNERYSAQSTSSAQAKEWLAAIGLGLSILFAVAAILSGLSLISSIKCPATQQTQLQEVK
jgi:hypothetical protein